MMTDSHFWSQRRVLVTGAKGFLGAHLVKGLGAAGAEVIGLVRDEPRETYFDLEGLAQATTLVHGDLTDFAFVERILHEYDVQTVMHLAAQALVTVANTNPLSTFESNIRGTYNLLEAARRAWDEGKGPLQGVVVASSDKAYGQQTRLPYTEDSPLLGLYPYDASKACADILARMYHQTWALPVAVTRCANLYGPGDLNFSRLIPHTISAVLEGQRPQIRSDGSPKRDYLFITDAVAGYLKLAERLDDPQVAGRAFNLGTGQPISVLEVVEQIISAVGREDIKPQILGQASAEIQDQYLATDQAREILGWAATTSLADGLALTTDWYRQYLQGEL